MKKTVLTLLFVLLCASLWANTPIKSYEEEYYSFLTLTGKAERPYLIYRNLSNNRYSNENGFWADSNLTKPNNNLTLYGPSLFVSYNTERPWGQNDNALWQGVGFNAQGRLGFSYTAGPLTLTIRPEVDYSQNKEYDTFKEKYKYYWGGLDKPQRFGDDAFWTFSPGDSEVRIDLPLGTGNATVSAGYGELWLGPTYLNSVLHSNNAPTYPRLDIGFNNLKLNIPWTSIPIGTFEAHFNMGVLKNSDYSNGSAGEKSFLHLYTASYRPSFFENLTIGGVLAGRSLYSEENIFPIIRSIFEDASLDDFKMSVSLDFLFPEVGFEVYGELGRDDIAQFLVNPFHAVIWQLGLKKSFDWIKDNCFYVNLILEAGNTDMSKDAFVNWPLNFYTHSTSSNSSASNSYSNLGQLLGAGTGYAGNSQYLALQFFYRKGMTTLFAQRSNPDDNYIYQQYANTGKQWTGGIMPGGKDNQYFFKGIFDVGINSVFFATDRTALSAGFVYEVIANDHYREDNYTKEEALAGIPFKTLTNWHFDLGVSFSF